MIQDPNPPTIVSELLGWIEDEIPKEHWESSGDTPLEAVIYAMAVSEAEDFIENITVREVANLFVDGFEAYNQDSLADWIELWREADDPEGDVPRNLQVHLKKFWGVK